MLRCVDDSGRFIDLTDAELCGGFVECGHYTFFGLPTDATLFIDDEPLHVALHEGQRAFSWEPRFYAGAVLAELIDPRDQVLSSYRLDVSPSPNKLGKDEFKQMIDELFDFDPRLIIGTEAAQASVGAEGTVGNPHLEYERLKRYGLEFLASLRSIAAKPLTRLHRERALRLPHQARHIDSLTIRRALANPGTLVLMRGSQEPCALPEPTLLDVPIAHDDLDNPANRTIEATRQAISRRVRRVSDLLRYEAEREKDSETRTPLGPRIARRLQFLKRLDRALRQAARSNPFVRVSRAEVSATGLNAVSAHPAYARTYRLAWHILRAGIAGEIKNEQLWLSPTWEVYERWCFLKITELMIELLPHLAWQRTYHRSQDDGIHFGGVNGNKTIGVWLQTPCPSWDQASSTGFRSISGHRVPDIMVTLESPERTGFLVLDAKYRTTRQGVLDGMQSAHTYKDCLRWRGHRPWMSLLLVPKAGGAEWLEAGSFQRDHGVGAIPLGIETGAAALADLLREFFGADAV